MTIVAYSLEDSTGSISSHNYEFSSDDDVFSEEEDEKDEDEGPPAKKPSFYLLDDDSASSENEASTSESMIVYNSNVVPDSQAYGREGKDVYLQNKQNNNTPMGATMEVLDNRGSSSKKDTIKVDNNEPHRNVQTSKNVQGDVNENSKESKSLARVIASKVPTAQGNNVTRSIAAKEEKGRTDSGKTSQSKPGSSQQDGQTTKHPIATALNVKCMTAPTPSPRGDVTPPIVVEMWEETDTSGKTPKHSEKTPASHQPPTDSAGNSLSATGNSREEREPTPTPFFNDQRRQRQRHQPQQQQQPHITGLRGPSLSVPGKSTSKDGQDFKREPTPFYDHKKDTNKNALQGNSLGVPGVSDQNVRSPRESTPFQRDKEPNPPHQKDGKTNLAPPTSSLAVPTTGGVRDARESTPYYNETDPYEYIHHPDHHFGEKKLVLVKQNSKEDDPTTPETKNLSSTCSGPSKVTPAPAKRPSSRPPEPPCKPPQNLPLILPPHPLSESTVSRRRSCSPSEKEPFSDSYQRRLRNCRQTPPPESKQIAGNTSKIATLQSPVKPNQSVISLIPGQSLKMDKNDSVSSSSAASVPSTNATANETLQAKFQQGYTANVPDSSFGKPSKESHAASVLDKTLEISKKTNTMKESNKTVMVTVNKKTTEDKSVLRSSGNQVTVQSVSKGQSSLPRLSSSYQSTMRCSTEETKTTTDTLKQSLVMTMTQTKIPAQVNTQSKTVSEISSAKFQTSSMSSSKEKVTTVTTSTGRTTGIPLPTNSKGLTTQKTAPLAAQESLVVKISQPSAAAPAAKSEPQISEQMSSQASSSSASSRPRSRTRTRTRSRSRDKSPEISYNTTMAIGTSEYEQGEAFADDTPLLGPDSKPKRSLFSNIMSSRQDARMSSTPPADTTWKKKEGKPSGFSGALSSFLRPRRGKDTDKDETSVKDKNKRKKSVPDAGKEVSKREKPAGEARRARRLTQTISLQDLAKYSPFGRYTTEGFCLLFVMAVVCLYLNIPIEKFVCYVLAAFYTFCVLRILGLVE